MSTTRSSARLSAKANANAKVAPEPSAPVVANKGKRKASTAAAPPTTPKKAKTQAQAEASAGQDSSPLNTADGDAPVPAVLTFDFQEAMQHLVNADSRFQDLFDKMPCQPFEHLEQAHPFRALSMSILGQQISWKAARSIKHKFVRLYNPSISEEVTDESQAAANELYPTPTQVSQTEIDVLRTAGLSERKAQYIQDLARRFADGRLSTEKLLQADDDDLANMLTEVKGIGRWTVDMFAIFSLRRPDILPVGDLGVQRGLLRWVLAQYSPAHPYTISPEKVGGTASVRSQRTRQKEDESEDILPTVNEAESGPAAAVDSEDTDVTSRPLPPLFTSSLQKTLEKAPVKAAPLPGGITTGLLKSRLDGKKVK